jgi:hypothetical protein
MGILKAGETVFYRANTCMFTLIWDLTEKELGGAKWRIYQFWLPSELPKGAKEDRES